MKTTTIGVAVAVMMFAGAVQAGEPAKVETTAKGACLSYCAQSFARQAAEQCARYVKGPSQRRCAAEHETQAFACIERCEQRFEETQCDAKR